MIFPCQTPDSIVLSWSYFSLPFFSTFSCFNIFYFVLYVSLHTSSHILYIYIIHIYNVHIIINTFITFLEESQTQIENK